MLSRYPFAAAAKSLQSRPTLCDPIDGSPLCSPDPGILQARTLEWVAISFSNAWKWKVKVNSLSRIRLLATPWTAAYQAPPSIGFSRQEYWSGVPLPSPRCPFRKYVKQNWWISLLISDLGLSSWQVCVPEVHGSVSRASFLCLSLPVAANPTRISNPLSLVFGCCLLSVSAMTSNLLQVRKLAQSGVSDFFKGRCSLSPPHSLLVNRSGHILSLCRSIIRVGRGETGEGPRTTTAGRGLCFLAGMAEHTPWPVLSSALQPGPKLTPPGSLLICICSPCNPHRLSWLHWDVWTLFGSPGKAQALQTFFKTPTGSAQVGVCWLNPGLLNPSHCQWCFSSTCPGLAVSRGSSRPLPISLWLLCKASWEVSTPVARCDARAAVVVRTTRACAPRWGPTPHGHREWLVLSLAS